MPQLELVAWATAQTEEFQTPWTFAGTPAAALRAVSDGNHAASPIVGGQPDSNPLVGTDWRLPSGVPPSWVNKVITNVHVQINVNNAGPDGSIFFAFVTANAPLTYAEQVFNGEIFLPIGVPTWATMVNAHHAQIEAALLANNFLISLIHYNHTSPGKTMVAEAARVLVDYIDTSPTFAPGIIAMEV